MAKNRYNKRDPSDMSMIEISENGVIKKILVPMATMPSKGKKKTVTENNQNKVKHETLIAPKRQASGNACIISTGSNTSMNSQISNVSTVGQLNQTHPISACSNFLNMPQSNCLSSSSFVQPYHTVVLNHPSLVINSGTGQSSGPLFSTSVQQQPLVIASKTINPNVGSSFVLQSNANPIQSVIQLPSQNPQIQIINNNQAMLGTQVNSLNHSRVYLNQSNIQNAVLIAPPAKPVVLNHANHVYTQHIRPVISNNSNVVSMNHHLQNVSTYNNNSNAQGLTISELFDQSKHQNYVTDKTMHLIQKDGSTSILKVKKILPKTLIQPKELSAELPHDKQNLINKLTLAAERSCNAPLLFTLNGNQHQPNSIFMSSVPLVSSSDGSNVISKKLNDKKRTKGATQFHNMEGTKGKLVKSRNDLRTIHDNHSTNNSASDLNIFKLNSNSSNKLKIDEVTKHALGNQVPTVVLNPISIPPGVTTAKVTNLNLVNKDFTKINKLKPTLLFRSIKPKPSISITQSEERNEIMLPSNENQDCSSNVDLRKLRKCTKSNVELDNDYTIAQMLDTDDSWIIDEDEDDEDDYDDKEEIENKRWKNAKQTDKSYKCYLGRATDCAKYPRTRSSFKSRQYN